jgi:hypothetical protein
MCTGTTAGGGGCITKGESCTVILVCSNNGEGFVKESKCSPEVLNHALVNVPDGVIREIARLNPQAAIALISIRDIKLEFDVGKVNLFSIERTAEDVEKHLTLPESSDYFEEQRVKIRGAFANKQAPIVYEFFLNRDDEANTFSLRLKAVNSAESPSSFEINLSKVSPGRKGNKSISFNAVSWQAN